MITEDVVRMHLELLSDIKTVLAFIAACISIITGFVVADYFDKRE